MARRLPGCGLHPSALILAFFAVGISPPARGQVPSFEEDFECNDDAAFGSPAGRFGWSAALRNAGFFTDAWRTDLNSGVSPATDELEDGARFGPPLDWFENFLLTGHPVMQDATAEVSVGNRDNDGIGLVVRYTGPGSYYACAASNDRAPTCAGVVSTNQTEVRLYRVDSSQACANDYVVASTNFAYQEDGIPYRMRLNASGSTITCSLDANRNGTFGDPADIVLTFTDPAPFPAGEAGLVAWDTGNAEPTPPGGDTIFDDFVLSSGDPDADADGVPDAVERLVGTGVNTPDTDGDTILDRQELGYFAVPYDHDQDGVPDALDLDSDGDGYPDNQEAGDGDLQTPPVDSLCTNNGLDDFMDPDANPGACTTDADCPGRILTRCDMATGLCSAPDTDGDGIPDPTDGDSDNDGVFDFDEGGGVDPSQDSNGNGLPDFLDPFLPGFSDDNGDGVNDRFDGDGDGVPNHIDLDADQDGLSDLSEAGGTDGDGDGRVDSFVDTNGDGIHDPLLASPLPRPDTDATPGPDFLDRDADGDGITDTYEAGGTDTDGDGVIDGFIDTNENGWNDAQESAPLPVPDFDGDGRPNHLDTDSDDDSVVDANEGHDANEDGVPDRIASGADADADGIDDVFDPSAGGTPAPLPDTDGAVGPNVIDPDDDGDTLATLIEGAGDPDGDGVPAYLDVDADNDGVLDNVECALLMGGACPDSDGDGRPDFLDVDDDGDGIGTAAEGTADTDRNGTPDYLDSDSDGDGFPDATEGHDANADGLPDRGPVGADVDGDGLDDAFDPSQGGVLAPLPDRDGDAAPDARDPDDDDDGLPSAIEGGADPDGDGAPNYLDLDSDGDSFLDASECPTPASCPDADGDGFPNFVDADDDGDGLVTLLEGDADVDMDGRPAFLDTDSDGDTVPDAIEAFDPDHDGIANVTPSGTDGDADGLDDAFDPSQGGIMAAPTDLDGDGQVNLLDPDDDGDGVSTRSEAPVGDPDGDGAPSYLDADDDGDGIPSLVECGRAELAACPDSDADGMPDLLDLDSDDDSLLDAAECASLPCPDLDRDGREDFRDPDDDGDGLLTRTEVEDQGVYGDPDQDGVDAWRDLDSDADTVPDETERRFDVDGDGIPDYLDPDSSPVDTDGDGIPDLVECSGDIPGCRDSDGDGRPDYDDPDDDDDGIPTRTECPIPEACSDLDMDGRPDRLDIDEDNDGLTSAQEGGVQAVDTDGDGAPDYLDLDSDGDGVPDATEAHDVSATGAPDVLPVGADVNENGLDDAYDPGAGGTAAVPPDFESDGFPDHLDVDADGDGVRDGVECDGEARCADLDSDGNPNHLDLDADDDGLPDALEAHDDDGDGIADATPSSTDANQNGLDDAFDGSLSGVEAPTPNRDGDENPDYLDEDDDGDALLTRTELEDVATFGDPEMDGVPPYLDLDSDDDGALDIVEARFDLDADGIPDYLDPDSVVEDSDGDTVPDLIECTDPNGPVPCPDTDGDGVADLLDPDDDGDGILTREEGPREQQDSDGDGTLDYLDPDDDGDGVGTRFEEPDPNGDGVPEDARDTDGDGRPDYLDPDDDGDGTPTLEEDADPNGDLDPSDAADLDGDGTPSYLDDDETVPDGAGGLAGGGGCTAAPGADHGRSGGLGGAGILAAVLVLRRRRRRRAAVGLGILMGLLGVQRAASAQEIALDRYVPAARATDGWAISRARTTEGHLDVGAMLQFDYARDPVVFEGQQGDASTESAAVVRDHLVAHLIGSIPLFDRWLVYGGIPLNLVMSGDDDQNLGITSGTGGIGDIYAGARVLITDPANQLVAFAVQARLTFPTAESSNEAQIWVGESGVTGHPEAVLELHPLGDLRLAANVGARIRGERDFGTADIGSELTFGLGVSHPIYQEDWAVHGDVEIYGASTFSDLFDREQTVLEALAGVKVTAPFGMVVGVAAGPGLSRGLGSPDFRGVAMLGFAPSRSDPEEAPPPLVQAPPPAQCPEPSTIVKEESQTTLAVVTVKDDDEDGVPNDRDECPNEPEDEDGFADDDGCPDPDNDDDKILDVDDNCPFAPGKPEHQGCPTRVVYTGGRIVLLDRVEFDTAKDNIAEKSFEVLKEVRDALAANEERIQLIRIEGHSDSAGGNSFNLRLSVRRARSVRSWLIDNGIAPSRLIAIGCGENRPIDTNATRDGRERNRRVDFQVLRPAPNSLPSTEGCQFAD